MAAVVLVVAAAGAAAVLLGVVGSGGDVRAAMLSTAVVGQCLIWPLLASEMQPIQKATGRPTQKESLSSGSCIQKI